MTKPKRKTTVFIRNEQNKIPVHLPLKLLLRRAVNAALDYEGYTENTEVSITLTDDAGIHRLNRQHRHIDRPTDVLSFPMEEKHLLGDIVISLERARAQAGEYGHSFARETAFLCVHSVLHLLGYDHERSPEEEKDMFARQEAVLAQMGLRR